MVILLGYAALLGLILGSFSNVVIYRVPLGRSIVTPRSGCPHCGRGIGYLENMPVVSYLLLRGRCSGCRASISLRYPLVEAGMCGLFVAITLRLSALDQRPALAAYLYFAVIGVMLALIDIDTRRLPDVIVLPSYVVLLVLLAVAAAWQDEWASFGRAVVGGAALYAFYFALAFVYPAGMGFGDVKLSGLVGGVLAYLSWGTLVVGAFAGFLLGSIVGLAMIATARGTRKSALPFGPFMISGALVAIFAGDELTSSYLRLTVRG